jgi:hypothetical protein
MQRPPSPARTTTTPYSYAERLVAREAPRGVTLRLGLRWSFGLPSGEGLDRLTEYSLPLNPEPILDILARRGGIRMVRHAGDDPRSLHDHLAGDAPAIVAIDAFYLPFRPAYRRIHSARTVLVHSGPSPGTVQVWDGWRPSAEGVVPTDELDRARYSTVALDVNREALFAGNPVGGTWFSVEAGPFRLDEPAAWARDRLAWLYDEMATPRRDERGEYGIGALSHFCEWIEERMAHSSRDADTVHARRVGSLLLRPELSSRLYLGVFLRNVAHFLGDSELQAEVDGYRERLGHLQAAMDVLTKTVRSRRPEYDRFVLDQLARARRNEEALLESLSRYAAQVPPSPPA